MSIRLKLGLLLGVVALAPAITTAWLDARLLRGLGADLTRTYAEALSAQTVALLEQAGAAVAATTRQERARIEQLMTAQAHYAEHLLQTPATAAGPMFFADDFDRGLAALELSSATDRVPRSWRHQVFHHGADSAATAVMNQARALLPTTAFYQRPHRSGDVLLRWHYIAPDNGLSAPCQPIVRR